MSHEPIICQLKNIHKHPNADKLILAEVFGNQVIVDSNYNENDLYIYFQEGTQLSKEYCEKNDLVRRVDENGKNVGGYLDPKQRRITTIKLRGEVSDGLVMPISSLTYTDANLSNLSIGEFSKVVNGHEICDKYIPLKRLPQHSGFSSKNTSDKKKLIKEYCPLFKEHVETNQLVYHLSDFKPNDQIEITLKMHGTSQRVGYLPVLKEYKRTLKDIFLGCKGTPIYEYKYITGTRKTVLTNSEGGYYDSNKFREQHSKIFEGKLHKGETVYFEVVGYTDTGSPIMGSCNNNKVGKDFIEKYGQVTEFSYGCNPDGRLIQYGNDEIGPFAIVTEQDRSKLYVYRMTFTNEDGYTVEYSPDYMRFRCEEIGVPTVPVFWQGYIPEHPAREEDPTISAGEWVQLLAKRYYDGPDPIGKVHVREGVVVRIVNRPTFQAYKYKNDSFKILSGLIVENAKNISDNVTNDILSEM